MKLYTPRSLVTTVCDRMRAALSSVTATPGRSADCSSVTTPVIVPVCVCARAAHGNRSTTAATNTRQGRVLNLIIATSSVSEAARDCRVDRLTPGVLHDACFTVNTTG